MKFKNQFLAKYLAYMSLGWLVTLLMKLNFSPFLSQGVLTLPALAIIWLWWPIAAFLVWSNFKSKKTSGIKLFSKNGFKWQSK